MQDVSIFYGHFMYFMASWYILWSFGILFHTLVYCTKKNLSTPSGQILDYIHRFFLQFLYHVCYIHNICRYISRELQLGLHF
jgi:hypothetical protein